jgi:hypothetical protein
MRDCLPAAWFPVSAYVVFVDQVRACLPCVGCEHVVS